MKLRQVRVKYQPYGDCNDCSWDAPESAAARNEAKAHATVTGHSVRLVIEDVTVYQPEVES